MNRKEKSKKSELNILNDLVPVINQYFPELIKKFNGLTDLRNQSSVKYKMKVIFIVRLIGLMCEMKSMRRKKYNENCLVKKTDKNGKEYQEYMYRKNIKVYSFFLKQYCFS